MAELNLTIAEIKELMDKLSKTDLQELSLKQGEFELKLSAKQATTVISEPLKHQVNTDVNRNTVSKTNEEEPEIDGNIMKSPIVGTFYQSPAPDKEPFITVGSKVKKGDVLCVIESMKLMNEVQSEFDGEVIEILVKNSQIVEYNQPLMIIK